MAEKYFITTAISYTNGDPHIGHAYEFIIADFLARFAKISGKNVLFLTGTDEHGQKIQRTAEVRGLTPKEMCDLYVEKFKKLDNDLSISFDRFIRTTDKDHIEKVHELLDKCKEDIYLGVYSGWYDIKEETFISDKDAELHEFKNPSTGEKYTRMEEPSYFFKLSKYQDQIRNHILNNPGFITPESKRKEILLRLEKPLTDLSISRTSMYWGIPIPSDKEHVLYVWFDALTNYISGGFKNNESMWPANIHVIGKDIVWFHSVIWLGMLMSANTELPEKIFVHNFINDSEGKKMSKSVGNVVNPFDLIDKYPVSAIRYYLLKETTLDSDVCFDEKNLVRCHDTELLPALGNFVNRVFGLFHKYSKGVIPNCDSQKLFDLDKLAIDTSHIIESLQVKTYIDKIFDLLSVLNKYVNDTKIWEICNDKYDDDRDESDRQKVIKTLLESMYIVAHYIYPIMPDISDKIFGYLETDRTHISSLNWSNLDRNKKVQKQQTLLFTIIDDEKFEKKKTKIINKKK